MRVLLFTALIFSILLSNAQPPIKTVPGIFLHNMRNSYEKNSVSTNGNTVALRSTFWNLIMLVDPQKGSFIQFDRGMPNISSNHRYMFSNNSFTVRRSEYGWNMYGHAIESAGIKSDTTPQKLVTDYYALDMDDNNNFIASRGIYDSVHSFLKGLKGIYRMERSTGKILEILRDDTLFRCEKYDGCLPPEFHLQKNYLAILNEKSPFHLDVYPFGSNKKISIPQNGRYHIIKPDSLFIFAILDSANDFKRIKAFDSRTGELVASKLMVVSAKTYFSFGTMRNRLYVFNPIEAMVYEETVGKDTLTTTRTWNLGSTIRLSKNQDWNFAVLKGPSFFFAPFDMKKGEAGGVEANSAFAINTSGKPTFQVYPFFNRTPDDVASQALAMKNQEIWHSQMRAKQDSINHPEKYCAQRWGVPKYRRGLTISTIAGYMIMAEYDCKKDEYKLWRPQQPYNGNAGGYVNSTYIVLSGANFRSEYHSTDKQWITCTECDGDGTYEVTQYTTKTKDLPWGYFSGIETKKITTTSKTRVKACSQCSGQGVVLK